MMFQPGDIVFCLGSGGEVTFWNQEAVSCTGLAAAEVVGRRFESFLVQSGPAADRRRFSLPRVLAGRDFAGGFECVRKDGSRAALYLYATAGRDARGNVAGVVVVAREVTDFWRLGEAPRTAQERFGMLFEQFLDAVVVCDRRARVVEANAAACRLAGRAYEHLVGLKLVELIPPEQQRAVEGELLEVVRHGRLQSHLTIQRPDGEVRQVAFSAARVRYDGARMFLGIGRDVTEERRAAGEQSAAFEKYRRLFASAPDAVFLETLDGRILEANDSACRMLGYAREELLALRVADLMPPEALAWLPKITEALIKHGVFSAEGENRRKDGRLVPVEVTCSLVELPPGPAVLAMVRDITERKQAQARLEESEASFRALAENAADAIIISRDRRTQLYHNPQALKMTGYSADEFSRVTMADLLVRSEEPSLALRAARRAAGEPVAHSVETALRHKDGHLVPVEASTAATTWRGEPATIMLLHDITERVTAERQARVLAETAVGFVRLPADADLFDYLAGQLKRLFPGIIIALNSYDEATGILRVRWLEGLTDEQAALLRTVLGTPVQALEFPGLDPAILRTLASGKLTSIPGGLAGALFGRVPEQLCRQLEAALGLAGAYSIGLRREDRLYGNFTLFLRQGQSLKPAIAEAFAGAASVALERRLAEDDSRERRRQLATLLANLPGMAYRCANDDRWTMQYASDGAQALTGCPPDELVGHDRYSRLIHPRDRAWTDSEIRAALEQREPFQITYRLNTRQGEKWVWEQGRGIYDETGTAVAFEGFITDITPLRQAEDELRASREQYRTIFQDAPLGIYRTTPDGRILLANPALARMLGYASPEELMARNLSQADFEPGYAREEFLNAMQQHGEVKALEAAWRRKDGTTLYIRENARAVKAPDGTITHYDGTVEDITQQHRALQRLAESKEQYRQLVQLSPDGIAVHQDGRVVMVNAAGARMLGYADARELLGTPVLELLHPDDRERAGGRIRAALAEGRTGELIEERFRQKDGAWLWVEVTNAPFNWQGRPAVQVVVRDISERRWLQSKLEEVSAQMQAIFQNSPHGLAAQHDGRITYANRGFARIFGYADPSEMYGLPVERLIADQDRDRVLQYARRREQGQTAPATYRFKARRRDGTIVELDNAVSTYRVGDKLYILGSVRPVTAKTRTTE